jgi:endoglucanase
LISKPARRANDPGLLAGGPNPGHQDSAEVTYSSDYPDESYEDVMPSYASNEIAINWNASLVSAINWLKYEEGQRGSKSTE